MDKTSWTFSMIKEYYMAHRAELSVLLWSRTADERNEKRMKAEKNREKVGFMNDVFQVSAARIRQIFPRIRIQAQLLKATDLDATTISFLF